MNSFDPKRLLENMTTRPGVYQMLDARNETIYVGKARNLKDRISSYFRANLLDPKTVAMVQQIENISVTITHTEGEALLLENNLIKTLQPRYNILLKDDKSYPYLFLSAHSDFPRLDFYRGAHVDTGEYYGPYPSARAVHETLDLLQKLFKIRQCKDSFFKLRTRPCLQYQIKRCTAPCVHYIDAKHYQADVAHARLFLQGKSDVMIKALQTSMEQAATEQHYEEAAHYRDQIQRLRQIQERQYVMLRKGNLDIIAIASQHGIVCIQILFIRDGRLIGDKSFFPKLPKLPVDLELESGISLEQETLSAFLPQYYLSPARGEDFPEKIMLNIPLPEANLLQFALSENLHHKIEIICPKRGQGLNWIRMAHRNAQQALANHLASKLNYSQWLTSLQTTLPLPETPKQIECFDISHTMGEATVASCVVFGTEGPIKKAYRRFNITGITPGDDYAAMRQALMRRYAKLKAEGGVLPDLLIIDGGKGQLTQAVEVLEELQMSGIALLGVAKGEKRKPGLEKLFLWTKKESLDEPLKLPPDEPAFHLIQKIRDEAHRFAIAGHRQQRAKARVSSKLENIEGIGLQRRRQLLRHFGGMQGIMRARIEDIQKVSGISANLATRIYHALHGV